MVSFFGRNRAYTHAVKIGDVDISIECKRDIRRVADIFKPAKGEPNAYLVISLHRLHDSDGRVFYATALNDSRFYWDVYGNATALNAFPNAFRYEFLKVAGFYAGFASTRYAYCRAAGVNVNGKGIALVGVTHSGKSTLVSELEGEVLSDGALIIGDGEMQTVGRLVTIDLDGTKVQWYEGRTESPLDCIFWLNRTKEPGYARQLNPSDDMDRKTLVFAMFDNYNGSPRLYEAYAERLRNLKWPAKVFEIGTKGDPGEPKETKMAIERIVSKPL